MKLKHYDIGRYSRFITFCTHNRIPILNDEVYCNIILDSIRTARETQSFKMIGYVFMPEHIHLVIIPEEGLPVGQLVGKIKELSSKEIHKILKLNKPELQSRFTVVRNRLERFSLWQRRCFDYNCRSESSMWEKVNYCHNNPVARKIVRSPGEWQYSSYNWYNGQTNVKLKMDSI
ncbi:MAG: hypothetical protein GY865_14365 [candidate division Zixibacteria bacterium]|nr:hypothetical protein [candidate division Zixibacteria bacterium]